MSKLIIIQIRNWLQIAFKTMFYKIIFFFLCVLKIVKLNFAGQTPTVRKILVCKVPEVKIIFAAHKKTALTTAGKIKFQITTLL